MTFCTICLARLCRKSALGVCSLRTDQTTRNTQAKRLNSMTVSWQPRPSQYDYPPRRQIFSPRSGKFCYHPVMRASAPQSSRGRPKTLAQMSAAQRGQAYRGLEDAFYELGGGFVGRRRLSRLLGLSDRACCAWHKAGLTPASRVLAVESASGVSKEELRPDLYPDPG